MNTGVRHSPASHKKVHGADKLIIHEFKYHFPQLIQILLFNKNLPSSNYSISLITLLCKFFFILLSIFLQLNVSIINWARTLPSITNASSHSKLLNDATASIFTHSIYHPIYLIDWHRRSNVASRPTPAHLLWLAASNYVRLKKPQM